MAFPGTYNFNYYRGDTLEFIIRPKDANGDAFELDTFVNAEMVIADRRGVAAAGQPAIIKINAVAEINNANDIITCRIPPNVGRSLSTGRTWVYDVQISDESQARIYTILTGNITVTDDITGAV
jgi:hypothetical protein